MADGLPSNNIHAIKKDGHGFVWFTTDFGLYKFKPGEKRFISYPIETGTLNASFTALSFYKSPGGSWFTFNSNEALGFDPAVLSARDSLRLPVTITGFKLPNDAKHFDALPMQDKPLKLLYDQNFFTIEFAALNNAHPGQVSYQYKLSGIDKDWVSIGNRPFAGFTNIPPGDYSFNVRTDNAGIAGPVSTLQLVIEPPFWKTKWFYLLVILMAALLFYFLVKARMSAIRKEEKNLRQFNQEMAEMEMKALRSQMNPHFIFNCINSIDSLIQSNDKYQATVYLNKFAKLIRNILDSSKQNTVTVSKDLDTLNLYIELEQLRHDKKFEAEIQVDESILQEDFKIPALVIQPFVENAILHGIRYRKDGLGKLSITITLLDGQLIYRIKDNGVGRNHNNSMHGAERTSYGIGMSKERVKLFNGEEKASVFIWDLTEHDLPCGTEVEVRLNLPI
jgi:hypothetical protein